jgi:hypothetical protein
MWPASADRRGPANIQECLTIGATPKEQIAQDARIGQRPRHARDLKIDRTRSKLQFSRKLAASPGSDRIPAPDPL